MSRFNTGNPLGSGSPLDLDDNAKNFDEAVNAEQDTFQDRLGKSRLTWAGIAKAGSGDPAIAVDAAARAVDAADRAESAESSVEQNAEQIAQEAAQQAASAVIAGVDGQVAVAQSAADRAETAADIASTAGLIFPTSTEGQASPALTSGDYFWVESGSDGGLLELWRKGAATPTNTGRTTVSESLVATVQREMSPRGELWEESSNLLNHSTNTRDKRVVIGGDIVDATGFGHTDYIPVVPGGSYVSIPFTAAAFYDAGLGYISFNSTISTTGLPWIAPARARFVRLNYQSSNANAGPLTARVNAGTTLRDFEVYYRELLPHVKADFSQVMGQIEWYQAAFIETGRNLHNPETNTPDIVVASNGVLTPDTQYTTTDYIPVKPGEKYSKTGEGAVFSFMSEYDAYKNFIRRSAYGSVNPITVGSSCHFVRLSFQGSQSAERMFYEGEVGEPFEPYSAHLKGISLGKEIDDLINKVMSPEDRFMPDVPLEGIFSGVDYSSVWPEYALNITAAAVYQKYDELMAEFPEYITKQVLGEDDFGYTISAYHLSPSWPGSSFNDLKRPKIFITAGTHGYESIPPLACYLTFRDMLERWQEDPLLEALKYNADYIIIPVVNPSGWDDYTRTTRNGVDINRNFPDGWALGTPGSVVYGGPEPFSEPESRLIKQVFEENPDIAVCYDFHNFSGTSSTTNFIWIPTGQGRHVQHMASNLITSLTRKWRKEYDWFPPEPYFAGYTDGTSGGMIQDYAKGLGIKYSATFEVCGRWHVDPNTAPFDATHRTTMVEAWANWLLINMRALTRDL